MTPKLRSLGLHSALPVLLALALWMLLGARGYIMFAPKYGPYPLNFSWPLALAGFCTMYIFFFSFRGLILFLWGGVGEDNLVYQVTTGPGARGERIHLNDDEGKCAEQGFFGGLALTVINALAFVFLREKGWIDAEEIMKKTGRNALLGVLIASLFCLCSPTSPIKMSTLGILLFFFVVNMMILCLCPRASTERIF